MRPLALGFLGGAVNSAIGTAHRAAAQMDGHWQVVAGCFSRRPEVNAATGREFGVAPERVHPDWRALLAAEAGRLDAIAVLTPTPDHAPMVAACLEAGLPVICEKVLAATMQEAVALRELRERRNGFLAVTYNYSGYPMVRELRRLVQRGALGRLLHFQVEMPQEGCIRTEPSGLKPRPQSWQLQDGAVPTISLDLAVHLHQLLHYVAGAAPVQVAAMQGSHGWFPGFIDDVQALLRCADGLYGHAWFSKSALGHRNGLRLRLYGTEAAAEWEQAAPEELRLSHADGRREILDRAAPVAIAAQPRYGRFRPGHPAGFIEAFANLYADIALALRHWQATGQFASEEVFGAELAIEGLALLEAIQRAAGSLTWQAVEEAPSHVLA
ncbi:Gfo/Idh/MocA family protein [Siccirubricoccus phaeus]|uniref:Gfo/Idh/MocA family protein n=1 Tax=Siccirubricoccus phaeus TaxID=2595053 RepID=UPI001A9C6F6B|nr:Gfo/Idh/MocA family oxidoreductase [Siccirubricoccus phaeus]